MPVPHPGALLCMQFRQKLANFAVFCARHFFDRITSYNLESMNERKWLRRILFLETVAGTACVPQACHCRFIFSTCMPIYIGLHVEFRLLASLCCFAACICSHLCISVAYISCHSSHCISSIACHVLTPPYTVCHVDDYLSPSLPMYTHLEVCISQTLCCTSPREA